MTTFQCGKDRNGVNMANSEAKYNEEITQFYRDHGFMTIEAFRQLMGWSEGTLISRRGRGETPHVYKKGNLLLIRQEELAQWIIDELPMDHYQAGLKGPKAKAAAKEAATDLLK